MSEHALALALALSRRILENDQQIRRHGWIRGVVDELYNKTCGIVGTGITGQRMIQLAKALGMKVIAWTVHPSAKRAAEYGVEFVSLEEILRQADLVSLHVSLSPLTEKLIGSNELAMMKPTAFLVNTSRGAVVDEAALIEALEQRKIAGAGLDVFETEPMVHGHPFTKLDNVVLSPHIGSRSHQATMEGLEMAVANLEAFAAGRPLFVVATGNRR